MKVLCYALGGGHGHAVRAMALLRRLRALKPRAEGALIIPRRLEPWARAEGLRALCPPEPAERDALGRWAAATIAREAPDLLLVDCFPRGVLGELGDACFGGQGAGRRAWLVSRRLRPEFYLRPAVRAAIESRYAGLLWCEEPPPGLAGLGVPQHRVPPVLIWAPAECLSRGEARGELGIPEDARLVVGLGGGERAGELRALLEGLRGRLPGRPESRVFAGLEAGGPFPAMRVLRAADALVAACGYHAFHESRALGVPAVFVPERRLYDDQFLRARGGLCARTPSELEAALAGILSCERSVEPVPEEDGADAVWSAILAPRGASGSPARTGRSARR